MKKLIFLLFPLCLGLLTPEIWASNSSGDSWEPSSHHATYPFDPAAKVDNNNVLTIDSTQWNANWPLDFSITYSDLYGAILKAQYTTLLGHYNAASILVDGGEKQYRVNFTWGTRFGINQLAKLSIDHLAQKMQFNFTTQDKTTWVAQNAYGVAYKFLRPRKLLNDIDIHGYYSQAQNKDFDSITYFKDGAEWRNDRRVAGGIAFSGSAGVHFLPTHYTLIGTSVNYSSVDYNTHYNTKNDNSHGVGGSVSLNQLITRRLLIHLLARDQVPLAHYEVGLNYLPGMGLGKHLNFGLAFARDMGGDGLPNDSQTTLRLRYTWQDVPVIASTRKDAARLTLGATGNKTDLIVWAHQPAVKMAQVLAIADQRTVRVRDIVMITLSNQGTWVMNPNILNSTLKQAEPTKSGTITIDSDQGTLDETEVLDQLNAAKDAQGNPLSNYLTFHIISATANTIKVTAALRGDITPFSGTDSFYITEMNSQGDHGQATLKLTLMGTTVPQGNPVNTRISVYPGKPIDHWPLDAKSFSSLTPIDNYKLCHEEAKSAADCSATLDTLSINSDGQISGTSPEVGVSTYWVVAHNRYGYNTPSASGPKVIVGISGNAPIGHDVNTLIYSLPSSSIPTQPLKVGSFTIGTLPAEKAVTYQLCPNQTDSTQCQPTLNGVTIHADQEGNAYISGHAPTKSVTDWILAKNSFGSSSLQGGPSVTITTGKAPQNNPDPTKAKTEIYVQPSSAIGASPLNSESFIIGPTPAEQAITYKLCPQGATDPSQCQKTLDGITIITTSAGHASFSGTAPTHSVTDWVLASNAFGSSQLGSASPQLVINVGTPPHGNAMLPEDVYTTAGSKVDVTFSGGIPFTPSTGITDYQICSAKTKQCGHTVDNLTVGLDTVGQLEVQGTATTIEGTHQATYELIAANEYGLGTPVDDGPRVVIHTGPVPDTIDVVTQPKGLVKPSSSIDLTVKPGSFSSPTSKISGYLLCPNSNSNVEKECHPSVNSLTIDNTGEISGTAPANTDGTTVTAWIVARNAYGFSKPSPNSPRVVISTYSTAPPTITVVGNTAGWPASKPWPIAPSDGGTAEYTVTVTPSKGNTLANNGMDVYSALKAPIKKGGGYSGQPDFSTLYMITGQPIITATKVQVTYENNWDMNFVPQHANYYLVTLADEHGQASNLTIECYGYW